MENGIFFIKGLAAGPYYLKTYASDREYVDEWRTVGQSECNCDLMKDARVAKLVVSSIGGSLRISCMKNKNSYAVNLLPLRQAGKTFLKAIPKIRKRLCHNPLILNLYPANP